MTPDTFFAKVLQPLIQATSTGQGYGQIAQTYDSVVSIIKPISFIVSVVLLAFAVYFIVATNWYVVRRNRIRDTMLTKSKYPKRRATKIWKEIESHAVRGDEKDWRIAIIEADKVLDEVLKTSGFPGMDLGERLKRISETQLPSINEVWEAHKLRNRIAHEVDFKLSKDLAGKALAIYENAFKELGALE